MVHESTERGARWRPVLAAVLIALGCLLAPFSVMAVWLNTQISDTEAFVETMAPLAEDPAVQESLADQLTAAVLEFIGVEELTDQLLAALGDRLDLPPRLDRALSGLGTTITSGIEDFTRTQVGNAVSSPRFAQAWSGALTVAHGQVVVFLEGTRGGALSAESNTISLNLGPIVEQIRGELVESGFTLAERIPAVDRSFVLFESEYIGRAQWLFRLLNTLGVWLPVLTLLLLAAGIGLARDRRRTLVRGALGVMVGALVVGVALSLARAGYVAAPPLGLMSPEAAGAIFDTLTRSLRTGLNATAIGGLVVALVAALAGLRRRAPAEVTAPAAAA